MPAREAESRYKHLLEPIRDLAVNWSIDIATELEEYLSELESITISFDEGETSLNFAEAALLIQGSACVYSKKVEYLYSLLYDTLTVLMNKRKAKQSSSVNADGVDLDAVFLSDDPHLLPLDDCLIESKNIDMAEKEDGNYEADRQSTLITRPPLCLQPSNSDLPESDTFRITRSMVHSSGALLMEEKDNLLLDARLTRLSSPCAGRLPFGSPRAVLLETVTETPGMSPPQPIDFMRPGEHKYGHLEESVQDGPVNEAMDIGDLDTGDIENLLGEGENNMPSEQAGGNYADGGNESDGGFDYGDDDYEDEPEEDPWEMADPHDVSSAKPRPFRRGKTYRAPVRTSNTHGPSEVQAFVDVLRADPIEQALNRSISKSSFNAPYFGEFSGLFLQEMGRRKKVQNKLQKQQAEVRREMAAASREAMEDYGQGADGEYDDDDEEGDLHIGNFVDPQDGIDEWDTEETHQGDGAVLGSADAAAEIEDELNALTQTYEDLCKEHVDAYMHGAQKYLSETQLSRRVADWSNKLAPVLKKEELHPVFDIHSYGRTMLGEIETTLAQENYVEPAVDFSVAVKGRERYQVCRYFLATLQLANNGNVFIEPSEFRENSQYEKVKEEQSRAKKEETTPPAKKMVPSMRLHLLDGVAKQLNAEGFSLEKSKSKSSGGTAVEEEDDPDDTVDLTAAVAATQKRHAGRRGRGRAKATKPKTEATAEYKTDEEEEDTTALGKRKPVSPTATTRRARPGSSTRKARSKRRASVSSASSSVLASASRPQKSNTSNKPSPKRKGRAKNKAKAKTNEKPTPSARRSRRGRLALGTVQPNTG